MSHDSARLDDLRPAEDLRDQERTVIDDPHSSDDPETPVSDRQPRDEIEADAADVADQLAEVPLDEEEQG
ncbi:hypothetical protein [Streptomyces sp. AC495_CC817]|uniref:hypothetical protein n=1 Tax=Streptomyces sp. AC495_CC817 TaxID=2823900 RepID=UPI001C25BFEC|nr:hypothetical protein [Streptomyces sp. AC495_CC817]